MADSSNVLAAARSAQKKKVMKGPELDLDMDALLSGVLGEGGGKDGGDGGDGGDEEEVPHGTEGADQAAKGRAAARESVVDDLLEEVREG